MATEATPEAVLPRGARLGEYILATEIASGGMGAVYLARRDAERDPGIYAIKVIHDDLARRFPELGDLLRKEARLAANIHHPQAVGVLEIGEHASRPYAVMPYVEGGTLADLILAGAATPEVVAAVMIDALRGLHAAHIAEDDRGRPLKLVHRDVCPENVLVGVDGRARIADFGIAVAAAHTLDADRGSGRGKWAFMSPEQLKSEPVDRRADVFSAGVTLFFALTGTELFRGHSVARTMQNVLNMPIPRPSEVGAKPPPALDAVCLRALERDLQARFPSAEAMASALHEAASAAGLLASAAEVGVAVREVMGQRLADRREALAALEKRSSARLLPLPPPNPSDDADEVLGPEEAALLAAELGDDDDDPDGPATSVYRAEEHGDLDDLEITVEGLGDTETDAPPHLHAAITQTGAGRPTMDLDPEDLLAVGSGEHFATGTPPGGSPPVDPADAEAEEAERSLTSSGRLRALWRRFVQALLRRG